MSVTVVAGTPLATAIQQAVQPKLLQNGWVAEENDQTLAEYILMMLVNGKTEQELGPELGADLLGIGEDDPTVAEFVGWLFHQVKALGAPVKEEGMDGMEQMQSEGHVSELNAAAKDFVVGGQDANMDDALGDAAGLAQSAYVVISLARFRKPTLTQSAPPAQRPCATTRQASGSRVTSACSTR